MEIVDDLRAGRASAVFWSRVRAMIIRRFDVNGETSSADAGTNNGHWVCAIGQVDGNRVTCVLIGHGCHIDGHGGGISLREGRLHNLRVTCAVNDSVADREVM